ncbi:MAG: hypothetical protein TU36_005380 [Vulcanisaeta sp. AZ3]
MVFICLFLSCFVRVGFGRDWVDFVVEGDDDLYVVYLIVDRGDLLYGWTVREFRGSSGERGERVRVYVGLRVESLEFHAFRGSLRIGGVLVDVPEWFEGAKGSHHTMELMRGLEYRLVKSGGVDRELIGRILELFSGASVRVLLVSVSMEEVSVALIRRFGVEVLGSVSVSVGGKVRMIRWIGLGVRLGVPWFGLSSGLGWLVLRILLLLVII